MAVEEGQRSSSSTCKLHALKTGNDGIDTEAPLKATFWPNHWRNLLCKCTDCKVDYGSIHLDVFFPPS